MDFEPWAGEYLHYPWSEGVSITATGEEPPVGFEPTTARLRIESSTTELRWRPPNLATGFSTRYSLRLDQVALERQSLQRHRNSLELFALCERDVGDGAAILQRRCDADCAKACVAS